MVAMHRDLVAGVPQTNCATDTKDNTRGIGSNDVLVEIVALGPHALFAQASERSKCADRFENAAPHSVEVDGRCHHSNHHFVWGKFWHWHFANMNALAGVLLIAGHAFPHGLVFLTHIGGAVGGGQWQSGDLLASCTIEDGFKDLFHSSDDSDFRPIIS